MVKLHAKQLNADKVPIAIVHVLTFNKKINDVNAGTVMNCYITEMAEGRYGVFSSSGVSSTFYTVMQSQRELHESFEEID